MMMNFTTLHLSDDDFEHLSNYIQTEVGIKMPPAKRVMLESRLQKRLRALGIPSFKGYLERVFSGDTEELVHMIDVITTNKTDFFREPDHFEFLEQHVLPSIFEKKGESYPLNVWSAGCSTGEEPYTLAMVLDRFAQSFGIKDFRITASDISSKVLEHAEQAIYSEEKIQNLSLEQKKEYFLKSKDPSARLARVKKKLRSKVSFFRLNFMDNRYHMEGKYDVIFCRNVLIYFHKENQKKILLRLGRSLKPHGYLFIGHSETMAGMDLPFISVRPTVYTMDWSKL
ncbi:MAG: CheR family methyltransferase [Spirochaetia bacterium]